MFPLGLPTRRQEIRVRSSLGLLAFVVVLATAHNIAAQVPSTPSQDTSRSRETGLASVDQLVLVLSNATDQKGQRHEVLVFLGRTKNRGWETVGVSDSEELSEHWRNVAKRQLENLQLSGLNSDQMEKLNLAVEVSIAQFQRLYWELRNDFLDQPDHKSRLAVLANDDRYERLRRIGREGIFAGESLLAKVINNSVAATSVISQ